MEAGLGAWYNVVAGENGKSSTSPEFPMTKPHRKLKKANHGARPANSKARKAKRKHIRT